jgi:hypothetical protein
MSEAVHGTITIIHPERGVAHCAPHQLAEFEGLGWTMLTETPAQTADAVTTTADAEADKRPNPKRADTRTRARTGKD